MTLLLRCCGGASILITVGIVMILVWESSHFFVALWRLPEHSVLEFVVSGRWRPLSAEPEFGIRPLVCGTLLVAGGAGLIAIPLGLATAIYLSEYAPQLVRQLLKPVLEILAGIPSVVYGYVVVAWVTPYLLRPWFGAEPFNAASASVVLAVMVLPMIISLSEDVLRAVPVSLRDAAYALGASKSDVVLRIVVPAGLSGIVASFLLALSRAVGETMAVALAAGATPKSTLNPLVSIQTMTGYIVQVSQGDTPTGSLGYQTIFAVGLALFVMTFIMNLLAQIILVRWRQRYE